MGVKSTVVLLGLAAGLGAAFVFLDEQPNTPDDQKDVVAPLVSRSLREVVAIELITGANAQPLELRRGAIDTWELVEPIRDRASQAVLESIGGIFSSASATLDLPADQVDADALAQRGLTKPSAEIQFTYDGGDEVRFRFGERALSANEVYLLRSDRDGVWRAPSSVKATLTARNRASMRDRRVFRHDAGDMRSLKILRQADGQESTTEIQVRGREVEISLDGESTRASIGAVQELMSRVAGLRVAGFPTGVGAEAESRISIQIEGTLGSESIEIWLEQTAYIAKADGRISWLGLDARDVEPLLLFDADSLRARALWTRPVDRAERVALQRIDAKTGTPLEGTGYSFGRVLGALELQQPIRSKADGAAVEELVTALRSFSGLSFVEGAQSLQDLELAGPVIEVELWFGRRASDHEVVRVGRDARGSLLAERIGDDQVVRLQTGIWEVVSRDWPSYVDRNVFRITSPSKVRACTIVAGGNETRFDRSPVNGLFEPDRTAEIIEELMDLDSEEVADARRFDGQEPALVARLLGVQDRRLVEFRIFREEERFWCVRPERATLAYRISTRLGEDLRSLAGG